MPRALDEFDTPVVDLKGNDFFRFIEQLSQLLKILLFVSWLFFAQQIKYRAETILEPKIKWSLSLFF